MKILYMNDPILHEPTSPVLEQEMEYVRSLVPEMTRLMEEEQGAGLAANQVGVSKRFCILKEGDRVRLIVNPEIIKLGEMSQFQEGCLSIPGVNAETQRAQSLTVVYRDENFQELIENHQGFTAVAIQHEVDHLDGKLYIDQLGPVRRQIAVEKHKKFVKMNGRR